MSLIVELRISSDVVGAVEITRDTDSYDTDPDSINLYYWSYSPNSHDWTTPAHIEHRYGDGAIALAHKVLGEIVARYQVAGEMAADR